MSERLYDIIARARELIGEIAGWPDFLAAARAAGFWFSPEICLRALAAAFLVACTLLACLRATRLLLPRAGLPLRWGTTIGFGMWLASVGFHALRSLGQFNLPAALIACSALAFAALRLAPERAPWRWLLRRELRAMRAVTKRLLHGRHATINAIFLGFAALFALRALIVPPLCWDTFTYHGPRAALWVQTGQFTFPRGPGPYSLYRNFFGGGELFMAWAMLPFHSDLFTNLAALVQWLGIGLSCWALARTVGLREPFASCCAGVALFIPTLQMELNSGYVEVALNAALINGIALVVYGLRRPQGPVCMLAAMAIGTAAGIKLTGAPSGLIAALALAGRFVSTRTLAPRTKLTWLAIGALCAALPVLPWLLFAWRDTGFPLSPMPVEIAGIRLGVSDPALSWYQDRPWVIPSQYQWQVEKTSLLTIFSPIASPEQREVFGSMALIPILFAPIGAFALLRRRAFVAALLCVVALPPVATHFSKNMSLLRIMWVHSVPRFVIPSLILAILLSLAWCRPQSWSSTLYRRWLLAFPIAYALLVSRLGWAAWELREMIIVGVSLALLVSLLAWCVRQNAQRGAAIGLLLFALGCSALQLRRDQTRPLAFQQSFALHGGPRHWEAGSTLIDEPEHPHRIAITGGENQDSHDWFAYAFYGKRLQNRLRYVSPTHDGTIPIFGPAGNLLQQLDKGKWIERLKTTGTDSVVSFGPRSVEQNWMEESPEIFSKLAGDPGWGLFRINSD